jgi:hypothetical protein
MPPTHPPPVDILTPTTRAEAEAAFAHNATYQSSSAGRPQPTTPLAPASNNYLTAVAAAGLSVSIPHPDSRPPGLPRDESTASDESGDSYAHRAPLSRGTTAVVLDGMKNGAYDFLTGGGASNGGDANGDGPNPSKRTSREGARHTSSLAARPVINTTADSGMDGGDGDEARWKGAPSLDRRGSWKKEDLKHSAMLGHYYMPAPDSPERRFGYSSEGGTPMYTG